MKWSNSDIFKNIDLDKEEVTVQRLNRKWFQNGGEYMTHANQHWSNTMNKQWLYWRIILNKTLLLALQ